MTSSAFERLLSRAGSEHVVVVGGGVAGLIAAWECAKVGLSVTVLEASSRWGGAVCAHDIDGRRVEVGATGWATRSGAVAELIDELGMTDEVIQPQSDAVWVRTASGVHAYGEPQICGIPANMWDPQVRRVIGWRGTWRAYLDRVRPPLTIGQQRNLGALVQGRMGHAVRDRLVAPITRGRYGVAPERVDVERIAPGLSAALTRTGSLSGAVAELTDVDAASASPIAGLRHGLSSLVDALCARLRAYDVELRLNAPAHAMRHGDDGWTVDAHIDGEPVALSSIDAVVCATDAQTTIKLLGLALPEGAPASFTQDVLTLVVHTPTPVQPRATVYSALPGAPVVSDESGRWGASGPTRVVRVTYGDADTPAVTERMSESDAATRALTDAAQALGIAIDSVQLRGIHRATWTQPLSAVTLGHAQQRSAIEHAVQSRHGVGVVGAWVAGPGLARVITHARTESERVRSRLLWGEHADSVTLEHDHPLDKREETP